MRWENRLIGDVGNAAKVTVDGKDFRIPKQKPFWKGWWSHKHNGPGLRYELGVSIMTGYIVWIHGPYPCGAFNDISVFRKCLKHVVLLTPGERVEADKGYRGERGLIDTTDDNCHTREQKAMKSLVRSRHETMNARIASFKICDDVFRYNLHKHRHCVQAVTSIVQLIIENGNPLFQTKKYRTHIIN